MLDVAAGESKAVTLYVVEISMTAPGKLGAADDTMTFSNLVEGGTAWTGGIQSGDHLVAIERSPVTAAAAIAATAYLKSRPAGEPVAASVR